MAIRINMLWYNANKDWPALGRFVLIKLNQLNAGNMKDTNYFAIGITIRSPYFNDEYGDFDAVRDWHANKVYPRSMIWAWCDLHDCIFEHVSDNEKPVDVYDDASFEIVIKKDKRAK